MITDKIKSSIQLLESRTRKEYEESPALNQSKLKALAKGVNYYNNKSDSLFKDSELYYKEKEAVIIGDAIDTHLTEGFSSFNEKFLVSNITKPGDKIVSIINRTVDGLKNTGVLKSDMTIDTVKSDIIDSLNEEGYYPNWKEETRWEKVKLLGSNYFNFLVKAGNRQILSVEENTHVNNSVMSLKTKRPTKKYLGNLPSFVTRLTQVPIYFDLEGIKCKALLDYLFINHKSKQISTYDLKCSEIQVLGFYRVFLKLRYDIQAKWYQIALENTIKQLFPDYTLDPTFRFIVHCYKYSGNPVIYECTEDALKQAYSGFSIGNSSYKGIYELMQEYLYYTEKGFTVDKVIRENKGILKLDHNAVIRSGF